MKRFIVIPAIVVDAEDVPTAIRKVTEVLAQPVARLSSAPSAGLMVLAIDQDKLSSPDDVFQTIMRSPDLPQEQL